MARTNPAASMSTTQPPAPPPIPSANPLSLRTSGPENAGFAVQPRERRLGGALGASVMAHIGLLVLLVVGVRLLPEEARQAVLPDRLPAKIVWLAEPGPGGGGGGGNRSPEPPKKAELVGKQQVSVPVAPERVIEPKPAEEQPPVNLSIPAQSAAADETPSVGVLDSTITDSRSTGSGSGGGAGSGQGAGLGPGSGGGTGGGVYQVGSGVETPRLVRQVKPSYTSEAMRAKVQGVAMLECIVETDGSVSGCAVKRSVDSSFGLDQEAVKAAQQWRFQPGTRFGEPVRVMVRIELSFTLR